MDGYDKKHEQPLDTASSSQYSVVLPCSQEDFGSFVSGLLGKPQTIEKVFVGTFEVSASDIENTFHLVDQRIRQQNEANLVQFTVRVVYDDGSSVLLGGLQDFLRYREVRPIASIAVHLSWVYLIRFQDKKYPEKQQIDMSIVASHGAPLAVEYLYEAAPLIPLLSHLHIGDIRVRISHTARTWGTDIELLLTGHIKTWLKEDSKLKQFISRHDEAIGFSVGAVVFSAALLGSFVAMKRFGLAQIAAAQSIKTTPPSLERLAEAMDYLVDTLAGGLWLRFGYDLFVFLFITLLAAILLGGWVGSSADNRPRSFVLLSRKAEEIKGEYLQKRKRKWLMFAVSVGTSAVSSLVADIIFTRFFSG